MLALMKQLRPRSPAILRTISTSAKLNSEDVFVHRDSSENNIHTPFEFSDANTISERDSRVMTVWRHHQPYHPTAGDDILVLRLATLIQNYPQGAQRSALGAALDIVQRQIGWIPISAMHKVAELLNVPRIRVYEYATFYTMCKRRYRGKFNVKVCVTTPCMLRGSDIILRAVEEATNCVQGGISIDGMFGVDTVQCQGACVNAPVIVVEDDYYEDVTVCDVQNIINCLRNGGIPPPGPQSGRFCCEPITGLTTLVDPPPGPGFCMLPELCCPGPCPNPPPPPSPCSKN